MTQLFKNNAKGVLSGAHSSSITTLSLVDSSVFPLITGKDWYYLTLFKSTAGIEIDYEIVKVTANNTGTNQLTVIRGQDYTTGTAYSDGDIVELRINSGTMGEIVNGLMPIKNGNFENGLTSWSVDTSGGGSIALENSIRCSGLSSLKLTIASGLSCFVDSEMFDIESNNESTVYVSISNSSALIGVNVYLLRYDSAGSLLSSPLIGSLAAISSAPLFTPNNISVPAATVGNAVKASIRLEAYFIGFSGSAYIDNVRVSTQIKASSILIADSSSFFSTKDVEFALSDLGKISRGYVSVISNTPALSLSLSHIKCDTYGGAFTPTLSGIAAGKKTSVIIKNTHPSSNVTLVYNTSWKKVVTMPLTLTPGQTTIWRIDSTTTLDSGIYIDGGNVF